MTEWQPIKTAPKDGTEVVIYSDVDDISVVCFYQSGEWYVRWDHSLLEGHFEATHWIPLPAPPTALTVGK